jgi:hypothetical protein
MAEKQPPQTVEERIQLMEEQRDHDEKAFGVRPELVLDATQDDADWIKRAQFGRASGEAE